MQGDDVGYGNMHPKLIWGRTKTISEKNTACQGKDGMIAKKSSVFPAPRDVVFEKLRQRQCM